MLIHVFSLVNVRLLMAFGTAFYNNVGSFINSVVSTCSDKDISAEIVLTHIDHNTCILYQLKHILLVIYNFERRVL